MDRILNIETATEICSVCISENGILLSIRENREGRSHAAQLTVLINELLNDTGLKITDLSAVAVSMGPGSYTGLRIGVSVAKGLCYGASLPLIAVPTLEAMYIGYRQKLKKSKITPSTKSLFMPMIDARRMEVYTAGYNYDGVLLNETSAILLNEYPFNLLTVSTELHCFGDGAAKMKGINVPGSMVIDIDFVPSSAFMVEAAHSKFNVANFVDTAYFEPLYLKDFIATLPKNKVIS